jgi:hypothetical protein
MRPRNAASPSESSLATLPQDDLRWLRVAIPYLSSSNGWQGTLAESRSRALRDDTTVITKPSTTVVKPTANNTPSTNTGVTAPYRGGYSYYPLTTASGQPNYYPSYYTSTSAASTGTASHSPYPYPAWGYNYPSPGQKGSMSSYPTYYPMNSPATQRAVANTTKAVAQQQANGWPGSALPVHMRRSVATTPSTPLKQVQNAPSTTT